MSSTMTTPERRGAPPPPQPDRADIPPEAAAHFDASESEWLTPQEFNQRRDLGWFDRSVLQKAVDRNACGLKDARRERTRRRIGGREQIIWEYPLWRIKHYRRFGIDGSAPPGARKQSKRTIKYVDDAVADQLADRTGRRALEVLHAIVQGELDAVLHPTEPRVLFLTAENARRWLNTEAAQPKHR